MQLNKCKIYSIIIYFILYLYIKGSYIYVWNY